VGLENFDWWPRRRQQLTARSIRAFLRRVRHFSNSRQLPHKKKTVNNDVQDVSRTTTLLVHHSHRAVEYAAPGISRRPSAPSCHSKMPGKRKRPYSNIEFTLKRVFKKPCFRYARVTLFWRVVLIASRPLQREVIMATLEGEDVFLQAATSFGKSLCYQLPAVVDLGSTTIS
jgi:hypothetical protein